jgi:hypothetical protein
MLTPLKLVQYYISDAKRTFSSAIRDTLLFIIFDSLSTVATLGFNSEISFCEVATEFSRWDNWDSMDLTDPDKSFRVSVFDSIVFVAKTVLILSADDLSEIFSTLHELGKLE